MRNNCPRRVARPRVAAAALLVGSGLAAHSSAAQSPFRAEELATQAILREPSLERGRRLYRERCAACHARNAWGKASSAIPALAGQHFSYLVKQMADFVELERNAPEMHRLFADPRMADPQRIADIAGYLRQLRPNPAPERGNSRALPLGGTVYATGCAQCHGHSGEGNDAGMVPSLRGQHYSYLLLQMRALATGHRFNTTPEVYELLDSMSTEQMEAAADFMTRLTPPVAPE